MTSWRTARRLWLVPLVLLSGVWSAHSNDSLEFPNSTLYTATGSGTCLATDPTVLDGTIAACTTNVGGPVPAGTPVNMRDLVGAGVSRRVYMSATSTLGFFTPLTVAPGGASEIQACSCDTGAIIAARTMNMICRKALLGVAGGGYNGLQVFSKGGPGDPPQGMTCSTGNFACCDVPAGSSVEMRIRRTNIDPACGFTMTQEAQGVFFDNDPPCRMGGIYQLSNGGNPVQIDLFPDYLLQVDRNGVVNGNLTVTVDPVAPGAPQSFTINTLTKTIDQLSDEIATNLSNLTGSGLEDLEVNVDVTPGNSLSQQLSLQDPAGNGEPRLRFANAKVVHIHNASRFIERITVQGEDGHLVRQENFAPPDATPTLNEWAMLSVALLLLASAYWLLRRRRQQPTA